MTTRRQSTTDFRKRQNESEFKTLWTRWNINVPLVWFLLPAPLIFQPAGGATLCFNPVRHWTAPALVYSWWAFKDMVTGFITHVPHWFLLLIHLSCLRYYWTKNKWTEKKLFQSKTIHDWQLGNVMLGKEQGSSKQTKGQRNLLYCNKMIDILISLTIHWFDF